jgi:hypothetical protein
MNRELGQSMSKASELERNPFRPGMGLEPPYLADRQYQLQRFARYLNGFPEFPRNVRVVGLRGVGKTVLLQRYAALAEESEWVVVRRELGTDLQDEAAFGLAVLDDCRFALDRVARRTAAARHSKAAIAHALDLLGGISVGLAGISLTVRMPSTAIRQRPVLSDQLFSALEATCRTAASVGRRGVILSYDEAHLLRDSANQKQFPLSALLAAVARAQRESIPVMLVVCGLPPLTDNLALAKSYSERMFQAEVLDALRPPEDQHAFERPLSESHRDFEPELIEAVRGDARGYPFHIQFFGALLWDSVPLSEPITKEHFRSLRPAILEALDHAFFDARLARTSNWERRLLAAIAVDGESSPIRSVLNRMDADHPGTSRLVARLVAKGLVYKPERGRLAFTVPLFGDYLRRKAIADG